MKPLRIIFTDTGLGKYYTYTNKRGKKHPVIELNTDMLKFDYELFFWIFHHELDHYEFYQKQENQDKRNSIIKELIRLIRNPKMLKKLYKFERKHKKSKIREFAMLKEDLEGYKMMVVATGDDIQQITDELQIITGKLIELDKRFGEEVDSIKKRLKGIEDNATSKKK